MDWTEITADEFEALPEPATPRPASPWDPIMARLEAGADGTGFTAPYTLELVGPEGTGSGEYGPGAATGARLTAEPMGTPAGTLGDLFGQSGGGGATLEASSDA